MLRTKALIRLVALSVVLAYGPGSEVSRAADDRFATDLFTSGVGGYHTYRIPSLVVTPGGTLLAFCEGRKAGLSDHGDIDLLLRRSDDEGRTWGPTTLVHEEGGTRPVTIGNPCPVVDTATGTVWLTFCRNNDDVLVTSSRDDGRTWTAPRTITGSVKQPGWSWYATGPGVGIQLARGPHAGRLVIPCDHREMVDGKPVMFSHVFFSDDHGRTWSLGGTVGRHTDECQVVELADGALLINMRNYWGRDGGRPDRGGKRAVARSRDGGATWSPLAFDDKLIEPICQASLIALPRPGRPGETLLVFSNPASTTARRALTVRVSSDDGKSWPVAVPVEAGPAAYSCLAPLAGGRVGLLFERGKSAHITFTVLLAQLPAVADALRGSPVTLQEPSLVVAKRIAGEAIHDDGSRLAAESDHESIGTLHLRIVERKDDRVVSVPARVHLADAGGKPVLVPGLPAWRDHFNCDGDVRVELPPGRYTYTIERGPEYRRASGAFTVSAGEVREQEVILRRLIDLASLGWYSGETHVHRSLDDIPLLLRSEDLHVAPVLTVWNRNNHWKDRRLPARLLVPAGPDRAYHVLACEDERQGGALLYFNLSRPLELGGDGPEFPSPVAHMREAIEQPGARVDVEKPFWWDMPTWVATGKVRSIGLANNHMCRSLMYEDEAWGRPRDVGEFPPPKGNGFYSQALYYRLLNCGLRIPPSAGSASGVLPNPVGYNRVYVHLDGPFSYEAWWRGLEQGRSIVTNGPILLVEADGRHPGAVFRSPGGQPRRLSLDIRVRADDPLEAVEVIRDGVVVQRLVGKDLGEHVRPRPLVFETSGWFLVRAIAAIPETFRFASTGPFYVEVGESRATVHRDDVAFFVRWIDERIAALQADQVGALGDPARREEVLRPHREARQFFERRLGGAR